MKNLRFGLAALVILAIGAERVVAEQLLVASYSNDEVLSYNATTGAYQGVFASSLGPGSGGLGLALGPNGNVYAANENSPGSTAVMQLNGSTGALVNTFVPSGTGGLFSSFSMTFGPDGNLYVSNDVGGSPSSDVLRFNGTTGAFMGAFVPPGSGLAAPRSVKFGPDGNLYVANPIGNNDNTYAILKYNGTTGAFIGDFVAPGSGGVAGIGDFVWGPNGNLYVGSNYYNGQNYSEVLEYNGTTGAFMSVFVPVGSGGLDAPNALAFGPNGNLFVSSGDNNEVLEYNGTTGAFLTDFVAPGNGLSTPYGMLFDPSPNATPEPATLTLLASGLSAAGGFLFVRRRRGKAAGSGSEC